MAIPRVKPSVPMMALDCRRQEDFPAFTASVSKNEDTQRQYASKEATYRQASSVPPQDRMSSIEFDARAAYGGGVMTIEAGPDLKTLQRECLTWKRACELAQAEVDKQRGIMAREIAKDLAKVHRASIADFLDKQKAATEAYETILALRVAANVLCGADCLPPYAINEPKRTIYTTSVQEFERHVDSYVKGIV